MEIIHIIGMAIMAAGGLLVLVGLLINHHDNAAALQEKFPAISKNLKSRDYSFVIPNPNEPCDPVDACKTTGMCHMHSTWSNEPTAWYNRPR